MAAFVALIIFLITHTKPVGRTPEERRPWIDDSAAWASTKVPELRPWEPAALADLSTRPAYWYVNWTFNRYRGTVDSFAGQGIWLAFYFTAGTAAWSLEALKGALVARSTAQEWCIEIVDGAARIVVNGAPYGSYLLSEGSLLDANGGQIGRAVRPERWATSFSGFGNNVPQSYEVVLNDRVLGTISTAATIWYATRWNASTNEPLIKPAGALDEHAALWLLTLGVIEIGCRTFVNKRLSVSAG